MTASRGEHAVRYCNAEVPAHEGEEQACKAWYIIYGDLNPVIHKNNYNLRLESGMDLAILIMLQLCLFRSFICWQGKYKKNAVSRKTINERKYFYFTQRIFFVSVCVVHPPTFRWEIQTQEEGILLNQQSTFKSFWYKHCNYFISSKQNKRQQHIRVTICNMLWMSLLKKHLLWLKAVLLKVKKKRQKLWQPTGGN